MNDELKKLGLRIRPRTVGQPRPENPGHIAFNDHGNAVCERRDGSLPEDSEDARRARRRALAHPGLAIAEDEPSANAPIQNNTKGLRLGYNPYESGLLPGKERKKKRDLHQLSQWIEAKKKLNSNE